MDWKNIGIMIAGSGAGAILTYVVFGGDNILPIWVGYVAGYISHEIES